MVWIVLLCVMSVCLIISVYANINILKKYEKLEDKTTKYENYMLNLSNTIEFSDKKLKEIDSRELFKSDDEIGWFFSQIKYLQEQLNNFKITISK